jgi:hypothetical protein
MNFSAQETVDFVRRNVIPSARVVQVLADDGSLDWMVRDLRAYRVCNVRVTKRY